MKPILTLFVALGALGLAQTSAPANPPITVTPVQQAPVQLQPTPTPPVTTQPRTTSPATTTQPTTTQPTATQPAATQPTTTQPAATQAPVPGRADLLAITRAVGGPGEVQLTLTLRTQGSSGQLQTARRQDCAFAPQVRVLEVGTRRVVYPDARREPLICTQELRTDRLSSGVEGAVVFERSIRLPAGEYVVESWYQGFYNDAEVRVPALPTRVTVR